MLDLLLAAADALRLLQDAGIGRGQRRVGEQRAGVRHLAAGQIDRGGGRPVLAEQVLDRADGGVGAFDQRVPFAGIEDRRREHVGELHGAVVAQQHHPGVEHARHAGGEQSGARHHVETEGLELGNARSRGRRSLAADHLRLALAHVIENDRHVATGAVQVRLDHLQRERRGNGRVEGITAPFQDRHADGRRDPMGRRHDAERAFDFGPGGKGIGVDITHGETALEEMGRRAERTCTFPPRAPSASALMADMHAAPSGTATLRARARVPVARYCGGRLPARNRRFRLSNR